MKSTLLALVALLGFVQTATAQTPVPFAHEINELFGAAAYASQKLGAPHMDIVVLKEESFLPSGSAGLGGREDPKPGEKVDVIFVGHEFLAQSNSAYRRVVAAFLVCTKQKMLQGMSGSDEEWVAVGHTCAHGVVGTRVYAQYLYHGAKTNKDLAKYRGLSLGQLEQTVAWKFGKVTVN